MRSFTVGRLPGLANEPPSLEDRCISLCLAHHLWSVRHGWPYQELDVLAGIALRIIRARKPFHRVKVEIPAISGCLNETVWSNRHLGNQTKVRTYKSVIGPTLTYAAETRTDTAKTTQILEVTEMKALRRIINKTRADKMRNERIREICGIHTVTSWVQRRRTEWSVHISGMAEDRLVRRVHDATPVGRRNRGRPMKRWRDALV